MYGLLRYGVKVRPAAGENTGTVWLVNWKAPLANDFGLAEEVTQARAPCNSLGFDRTCGQAGGAR